MKNYIFDTSILLCLILEEHKERELEIKNILKKHKVYILDFTKLEISNALVFASKTYNEVEDSFAVFRMLDLHELTTYEPTLRYARSISKVINDSVYDSLYHATALLNDMIFLTLDSKYYQKAKYLGHIKLLGK